MLKIKRVPIEEIAVTLTICLCSRAYLDGRVCGHLWFVWFELYSYLYGFTWSHPRDTIHSDWSDFECTVCPYCAAIICIIARRIRFDISNPSRRLLTAPAVPPPWYRLLREWLFATLIVFRGFYVYLSRFRLVAFCSRLLVNVVCGSCTLSEQKFDVLNAL